MKSKKLPYNFIKTYWSIVKKYLNQKKFQVSGKFEICSRETFYGNWSGVSNRMFIMKLQTFIWTDIENMFKFV